MMMLCGSIKSLNEVVIDRYIAEEKFDGERIMIIKKGRNVKMLNRRGASKEEVYLELKMEMEKLDFDFIIDGEVCSYNGLFNDLQKRALLRDESKIAERMKTIPIVFHIFDLIDLDGENKSLLSLIERKVLLKQRFGALLLVSAKLSEFVEGKDEIEGLWENIKKENKEGIILKIKDSIYVNKRSNAWLKYKNFKEMEIEFDKFEVNNAGVKLNDGFNEVQVQGLDRANWIINKINNGERIKLIVQYLEKTNSGKLRFPSCKEVIGYG